MKTENGIVCLTFDDRNFTGWLNALPIFAEYNAHASFFISGEIDSAALDTMEKLKSAGHTVGLHTLRHLDAPAYFDEQGAQAYFERELLPQLEICKKAGIEIHSLAYPNNRRDERTDDYLSAYFTRFRAGITGAAECELFVSLKKLAGHRTMRGFGLGEYYNSVESEVVAKLNRAADENACVTFFSHNIAPSAKHINLPTELLVAMLNAASENGTPVAGFDELPDIVG